MKSKIKKGLVGLLGASALALGMSGDARGDGNLRIYNYLESRLTNNSLRIVHSSNSLASEGFDSIDSEIPSFMADRSTIYDSVEGKNLNIDAKYLTSITPYEMNLGFNGTLSSSLTNYLQFSFTNPDFEGNLLTLQTPLGERYDIRAIIDGTLGGTLNPSAGRFNLPDLPAGSYNVNTPYASYQVDFNPVPEPSSTLGLLAAAGATALAGYGALRGMRRRERGYSGIENRRKTLKMDNYREMKKAA